MTQRAARQAPPARRQAADRRIAERRKAIASARVRRRRRRLGWGLLALALAVGTVQLARTPLFGLATIHVEGTSALDRREVLDAAAVRPGEPYLGLDLEAIRRRVAALPRVAMARVVRDYPASLRIVVTERTPVASVRTRAVSWLVAADGTVLEATRQPPAGLPQVGSVPLPADVHPGSRLPPGNPLANALAALGGMRPDLRRQVVAVHAPSLDGLEFGLRDGTRVLYGLAVEQPAKDAAVLLVRRTLAKEGREVARIDVRNPSAPTVRAADKITSR
ncbi:MAG TPA: FtsQ-type POTRA domain-containing protein [Actinomycetes bacterium]